MEKLNLLTILFIGLKLANVITWSWFWVLSPTIAFGLFWIGVFTLAFSNITERSK